MSARRGTRWRHSRVTLLRRLAFRRAMSYVCSVRQHLINPCLASYTTQDGPHVRFCRKAAASRRGCQTVLCFCERTHPRALPEATCGSVHSASVYTRRWTKVRIASEISRFP